MKLSLPVLAGAVLLAGVFATAEDKKSATKTPPLLKHEMKSLTGKKVDLSKYNGKVLLIVNVASACGATPQYKPLEVLHEKYNEKGLAVLGFPCNQFGEQEPGSDADVAAFCQKNYGVKFDKPITPPNLLRAAFVNEKKDQITLEFDQPVQWDNALISEFYLDREKGQIASGSIAGNVLMLKLTAPSSAKTISYLDSAHWSQANLLIGANGIAALTFSGVSIVVP